MMTTLPDDDRIYLDRRTLLRDRLVDDNYLRIQTADELIQAWEVEADFRGLRRGGEDFWRQGSDWIDERRRLLVPDAGDQ